ncbi:MAG: hypothetical protein HGA53_04415 [Anaerolineaceae bacterium]|nr:hypothetical protein [Anaerolineaceae bacterium]
MKTKSFIQKAALLLMTLVTVAGMVFANPTGSVYAQTRTTPQPGKAADETLEKAYARQQEWLVKQDETLAKTDQAAAKSQEVIAKAKEKGLDTTSLESALSSFNSKVASARNSHAAAAATLATHAGFDASGKVTDRAAAQQTIQSAREDLKAAAESLKGSGKELRDAFKTFKEANQGVINAKLEESYQKHQDWFANQTENLQKMDDAVRAEELIAKAKENGKDTSKLEAALASFKTTKASAQAAHDKASATLATHAGFDASGKVTDPATARQTLKSANADLKAAHDLIKQALTDLKGVVQNWKDANGPTETPVP